MQMLHVEAGVGAGRTIGTNRQNPHPQRPVAVPSPCIAPGGQGGGALVGREGCPSLPSHFPLPVSKLYSLDTR